LLSGECDLSQAQRHQLFQSADAEPGQCHPLRWHPLHVGRTGAPRQLLPWLADEGSLTAQLVRASAGQFELVVLRQDWVLPRLAELHALGLRRRVRALMREVVLRGCNQDWVFARSLLPVTSLNGRQRHLRKQDTSPLGAYLFRQSRLCRSPIEIAQLSPHLAYVPARLARGQSLWGRRSVFYLESKPLLVSEVFLPDFCQFLAQPLRSHAIDD